MKKIVIPKDFNGPPRSANGGIAAGFLAKKIGGVVTVRLFSPPPLATPIEVISTSKGREAHFNGDIIMTAEPGFLDLEPPRIDRKQAEAATAPFVGHSAVTCFVCGPDRDSGLHLLPGSVEGKPVHATTWTPSSSTLGSDGFVLEEIVWGALDCPAAIMFTRLFPDEDFFAALVTITAQIVKPLEVGETYTVVAWPRGREDRKLYAGTALMDSAGYVNALSDQVCLSMPAEWGGAG